MQFWILLYHCLQLLTITHGARILGIFPIPGRSHFACNEAIMRSLYNAGHQITFVSPFSKDASLKNYTVIDTKQDNLLYIGDLSLSDFKNINIFMVTHLSTKGEKEYCYNVLGSVEIQDLLNSKEKQFDVMFVEITLLTECYLPIAEKLKIPVIGVVTLRTWKLGDVAIGNPLNPAVAPDLMSYSSDQMAFLERVQNFWYSLFIDLYYNYFISSFLKEIYLKFYAPELVNKKKVSVVFMNNHLSLSARSAVPNAIDIGGIHLKPVQPLPKDLQKFIDEAEHGVVVFSLGSIAKSNTMTEEIKAAFQNAFAEIPQRVIWKFDDTEEKLSSNVLLVKWMPQRDILAHKNVRAFISHCGMSSTYEAMSEGVPMILAPLLGDQYSNAAFLHKIGAGISLDVYSATKEKVLEALNAVINDTRYRDTMKAISERFKDRLMSPQESVVYWTEYVIKHDGALHMRSVGADMPIYQYLSLDVIAGVAIIIGVTFYILCIKSIKKII